MLNEKIRKIAKEVSEEDKEKDSKNHDKAWGKIEKWKDKLRDAIVTDSIEWTVSDYNLPKDTKKAIDKCKNVIWDCRKTITKALGDLEDFFQDKIYP